jgi:hypothetical protein
MRSLSRRLERLEVSCREDYGPARSPMAFINRQAFTFMSYEELKALESACNAVQEGRTLTGQELAAVEALDNATAKELEKAGSRLQNSTDIALVLVKQMRRPLEREVGS